MDRPTRRKRPKPEEILKRLQEGAASMGKNKPTKSDILDLDAILDGQQEPEPTAQDQRKAKLDVIEVRRHPGKRIEVPEGMSLGDAIMVLDRERTMQEEVVEVVEMIRCFPFDGALAFQEVLEALYGVTFMEITPAQNIFDVDHPPREISIEVAHNETRNVKWGRFRIPGTKNLAKDFMETSATVDKGLPYFVINATVRRRFEPVIREIARLVRLHVSQHSIYKNKAFRMLFSDGKRDPFGRHIDPMPTIRFLDLSQTHPEEMVFPIELEQLITINLFTPIRQADLVKSLRTPLKRGVLLTGPYGTGKTLLAYVTAGIAVESGWTFMYLENVAQLPTAIQWAKQFGRVVIFAEDLDKASADENSLIPNTLDGIDTKDSEIMVVLTTNHLALVDQLLLRPGRLDCVLPIEPPDAEAHARLIQVYGRGMLAPGEDFSEVAQMLADSNVIPAVTREVVERSKLAFIHRAPDKALTGEVELNAEDLLWSARTMQQQLKLLEPKDAQGPSPVDQLGRAVGVAVGKAFYQASQGEPYTP